MTTTPQEPAEDPEVVPSGDPDPIQPGQTPEPGSDPTTSPDPEIDPDPSGMPAAPPE